MTKVLSSRTATYDNTGYVSTSTTPSWNNSIKTPSHAVDKVLDENSKNAIANFVVTAKFKEQDEKITQLQENQTQESETLNQIVEYLENLGKLASKDKVSLDDLDDSLKQYLDKNSLIRTVDDTVFTVDDNHKLSLKKIPVDYLKDGLTTLVLDGESSVDN